MFDKLIEKTEVILDSVIVLMDHVVKKETGKGLSEETVMLCKKAEIIRDERAIEEAKLKSMKLREGIKLVETGKEEQITAGCSLLESLRYA